MPIDASIISRINPVQFQQPDPLETYGKSLTLQNLMQKGDLEGLQVQQARRGIADDDAVSNAYRQAGGDNARVRAILQGAGQYKQLQALDKFDLEKREKEATIGKSNAAAAKDANEVMLKNTEHFGALLDVARDQSSWDSVKRIGVMNGLLTPQQASQLPAEYNPQTISALQNAAMTRAKQLEDQRKREELGLKAANEPFLPGPNGPVAQKPVQDFQLDKAKKSAPNVSVKTDVKTGESLAGQIGPMMRDSTVAAEGAVKQVDAAQRIVQAVDNGKIFAGPLASQRVTLSQVGQILGVGGKDEAEKIANTRQTVRGLAELTLQGRQQMKGQGAITESEGKLAEKAMSGDIDSLTVPEIRLLAKASERAARFNHNEHLRKVQIMKDNPDLQHVAPFYQGPAMPPEVSGAAPVSDVRAQADAILSGKR